MAIEKLQILELKGTPRQRGRQHGEALRESIARHLELFRENIAEDTGLAPQAYLERFLGETDFLPAVRRYTPDLLEEVEGLAEGARQPFEWVFARQLSDEDPWFRQIVKFGRGRLPAANTAEHCSCLGTVESGSSLIAQNMDSPGYYDGFQLLLKVHEANTGVIAYVFTVAGKISLAGMNNRGVGICCNTVLHLEFNPHGLPEDFIVRKVLQKQSLAEVLQFMHSIPHASGQNYVLGDPAGVIDLECSAHKVVEIKPSSGGRLFHTNHPLLNDDTSSWDAMIQRGREEAPELLAQMMRRYTTEKRFAALQRDLSASQPVDVQRAIEILSDHTAPVCLHHAPDSNYTLGCLIMELSAQPPRLTIAGGPPCETPFETITIS